MPHGRRIGHIIRKHRRCRVPLRIVALFNLRRGVHAADYEHWARTVDLPTVNALRSVETFEVLRVTGRLGSDAKPPYEYAEIIDVRDMETFDQDMATDKMRAVAAAFAELADPVFLTTEKLA
jgi:hypothetical protein